MAKIDIFKESIIVDSFIDDELIIKIKKILKDKKDKNENNILSNIGGFQTNPIMDTELNKKIFYKAVELINSNYNVNPIYNFRLLNVWINENYKNCFNQIHLHPKSNFSGVYYVEVPEKSGELVFLKNDKSVTMMLHDDEFIGNEIDFLVKYKIQPLKYQMIIFPSHLEHMVLPNKNEQSRISISFNIDFIKNNG